MIKCGIIGGAGYTAGELIRLLLNHPDVELVFVNSTSNAGNKLTDVHSGLFGETDMVFTNELPFDQIDVLNKSALIYIAAKNMGFEPDGMSQEQLKEMSVAFNLPK